MVDGVSVITDAGQGACLSAFSALGSAERNAGTPVRDLPLISPAITELYGAGLDLLQRTARSVVNRIADDGTLSTPRTLTLLTTVEKRFA